MHRWTHQRTLNDFVVYRQNLLLVYQLALLTYNNEVRRQYAGCCRQWRMWLALFTAVEQLKFRKLLTLFIGCRLINDIKVYVELVIQHALLYAVKWHERVLSVVSATGTPRCVCHRHKYVTAVVVSQLLLVSFSSVITQTHSTVAVSTDTRCWQWNVHMRSSRDSQPSVLHVCVIHYCEANLVQNSHSSSCDILFAVPDTCDWWLLEILEFDPWREVRTSDL